MSKPRERGSKTRERIKMKGKIRTGMRSAYFCRMRSASAFRFSKGCSSLNLDRILDVVSVDDSKCFISVFREADELKFVM